MKAVQIDGNSVHDENGEIYLSAFTAEFFKLIDGEKIFAYEGDEIWNAVVHSFISDNKKMWYVELCSLSGTMNECQEKWNTIGFQNGFNIGAEIEKSNIITRMISLGYCLDEIEQVTAMNEELKDRAAKLI